jgi:hypothetical protein
VGKGASTTTLTASPNSAPFGTPITLTATVSSTSGTPTGTVQFKNGTTDLGAPVALNGSGQATKTIPFVMPGQTFTAAYAGDTNFAASSGSVTPTITFDHTVTANAPSTLTLSGGSWLLSGHSVGSTLTIAPGTSVLIVNATIGSGVTATNPGAIAICGSTLRLTLNISGANGFVLVGDPGDDGCAANTIASAVSLTDNTKGLDLRSNTLRSTVTVNNNAGGGPFPIDANPVVAANKVSSTLACTGNSPAPIDDSQPNTAPYKTGQCATL